MRLKQTMSAVVLFATLLVSCGNAYAQSYRAYLAHTRHSYGSYMDYHPRVHAMVKDGAVGAAAGAIVGLAAHRGIMHGALLGAGAGAGVGALRSGAFRWEHPVATNVGTAGIAGLGLFMAAHHGHL